MPIRENFAIKSIVDHHENHPVNNERPDNLKVQNALAELIHTFNLIFTIYPKCKRNENVSERNKPEAKRGEVHEFEKTEIFPKYRW